MQRASLQNRLLFLLALLAGAALIAVSLAATPPEKPGPATVKTGPVFKVIGGAENGSQAILEKRRAEVTERVGGKLSGHAWWLWGLTAIDYDRDGDPDLVMTVHGPSHGVVLQNQFRESGKLTFANVTRELGVDWALPSAIGRKTFAWDFDGNGWLDLVGVRSPHFLNQDGKKFVPSGKTGFDTFSPQAIVDLNSDGHPDIYNAGGLNGIWNPKTRTFDLRPFTHPLAAEMPDGVKQFLQDAKGNEKNRFLRVQYHTDHDLDGDGRAEVIVTGYASYGGDAFGRYLRRDREGRLVDATADLGLPGDGAPILVKDLDGDGAPELLIAASSEAGFYRNDGKGKFRLQPGPLTDQLRSRDPYLHRADPADFDNDGLLDLVVSKPRHGPQVIYANRGNGVFEALHKMKGWDSDPVAVCDLNDDGLLDVAVGGPGDQVTLYLNATPQPGGVCRLYPRMPAPNLYAVGTCIEAFRAGTLGKQGARPFLIENAHPDATPVSIGLGQEKRLDLRVTFPGQEPLVLKDVEARDRLQITPDGKVAPAAR